MKHEQLNQQLQVPHNHIVQPKGKRKQLWKLSCSTRWECKKNQEIREIIQVVHNQFAIDQTGTCKLRSFPLALYTSESRIQSKDKIRWKNTLRQTLIAIVSCMAIASCFNSDDTNKTPIYNPHLLKSGSTMESVGRVQKMDSTDVPSYTRTSGKFIKAGTPEFFPNSRHLFESAIPTKYSASKGIKTEPDSFEVSTFFPSNGNRVLSSWPPRQPAQVARVDGTPLDFSFLTVNQGLKSNYIADLIEDERGNIWIGTFLGGGVSVWDGSGFYTIQAMRALVSTVSYLCSKIKMEIYG